MTGTNELEAHYAFRDDLARRLEADLLGPVGDPHETLDEEPATAYITGVLYPERRDGEAERTHREEQEEPPASAQMTVDEAHDSGVAMANRQRPSAMGLTFAVDPSRARRVTVTVSAAVYEPIDENDRPVAARRAERRGLDERHTTRWRRRPLTFDPVEVDVDRPHSHDEPIDGERGIRLRLTVREPDGNGDVSVTATLVNAAEAHDEELLDARCLFQPQLRVDAPEESEALVDRRRPEGAEERERLVNDLLHRHAPTFATGHGCSVTWNWTPPPARGVHGHRRAATDAVWTTFVPTSEVLQARSNPDVAEPRMMWLAEAPDDQVLDRLQQIVDAYREWIADRSAEADSLSDTAFGTVAREQLDACSAAYGRMSEGIATLRDDPVVFEAFRMANEAMAHQRARTAWRNDGAQGEPSLRQGRWRPFQIGYILLCLNGIADRGHADRAVADLLWFPTAAARRKRTWG